MSIPISIIICTYNRDKYLYQTLEHIAANDFPRDNFEIVLVNNNSTDQTVAECERFRATYPDIRFRYVNETHQGLSFARNRGIQESEGETIVFLDDDAFMGNDYLQHLDEALHKYPAVAAFGGKITPLYENGAPPAWMSKWTYSWVSALDKGPEVCLFEGHSYPIGANMGFRRKALPSYGFNTALGRNKGNLMGGEEKALFNYMKTWTHQIYYFPDIEVQHVIPESRTTLKYIRKLATGIGRSERLRTREISRKTYFKRLLAELIKWGASFLLWFAYLLRRCPQKGNVLIYFRWYVSKGLIS